MTHFEVEQVAVRTAGIAQGALESLPDEHVVLATSATSALSAIMAASAASMSSLSAGIASLGLGFITLMGARELAYRRQIRQHR